MTQGLIPQSPSPAAREVKLVFESVRVGTATFDALPITAYVGEDVSIRGCIIGAGKIDAVAAMVDGAFEFPGRLSQRPDLAARGVAGGIGFEVGISTERIATGAHAVLLMFRCEGNVIQVNLPHEIELLSQAEKRVQPRIVVAGSPKTAGRHVAAVLGRYFGIKKNPHFDFDNDGEHVLTDRVLETTGDRPFAFHCHPMARVATVASARRHGVRLVPTWRNLGDIVISMDDHFRTQPENKWRNTYLFMAERTTYCAMPDQERYQFIIRNGIPWYLGFYTSWRAFREPLFVRYEWMAGDPLGYFGYLVKNIAGTVDEDRLRGIVEQGALAESGLNVGRAGRSAELLSDESKKLLEDLILTHPGDLHELWLELPWVADAARKPPVVVSPTGQFYLAHSGVKHRITTDYWLTTHGVKESDAVTVSHEELDSYREGAEAY